MIMQIHADICQTYANICKYVQIYANIWNYIQIYANISKYMQMYANIYKYMQMYTKISKILQMYANICKYNQINVRCPNFHFPELFGRFEFRILNSVNNYLTGSNFELRIRARFVGFSYFDLIWKGITTEHFHCFREYFTDARNTVERKNSSNRW